MSDDVSQGQEPAAQAAATTNTPTATTPTPDVTPVTTAPASTPPQEEDDFDRDRAMSTIRKLRDEVKSAKASTKELDDIRTQLKTIEDAKLTDQEKQQKRFDEAQQKIADYERQQTEWARERQELTTRTAIVSAAQKIGMVDPEAAYKLLDLTTLEFNEDGSPKNTEKVLRALLQSKPYLAGSPVTNTTNPPRSSESPPETDAQKRARIYGQSGNPFDAAQSRARGGGVVWNVSPEAQMQRVPDRG